MKEFLGIFILVMFFSFLFFGSLQKEEQLIKKHCAGLQGYEFGQCAASIY